jgi:hypothetical protein
MDTNTIHHGTRTPFQHFFLAVAARFSLYYASMILEIPDRLVHPVQSLPFVPDARKMYLLHDRHRLFLILGNRFRIPVVWYKDNFYHSFRDEPFTAQKGFRQCFVNDLIGLRLTGYLKTLNCTDDDYFVYTPSKRNFRNYIVRDHPTLLGNFLAAEKLHYHRMLKEEGLIHPSTEVFYGQEIFRLLTTQQGKKYLEAVLSQQHQGTHRAHCRKIIKLPFSSSSTSVQIGIHASRLYTDEFIEYGMIVQDTNIYPVGRRVNQGQMFVYELRCMVVDGEPLCGCVLETVHEKMYKIRVFEAGGEVSPFLERFIADFRSDIEQTPPGSKKTEMENYLRFLEGLVVLLEDRMDEIRGLVSRAFAAFNEICIREPLPTSIRNFKPERPLSERQDQVFRAVRSATQPARPKISNKVLVEEFLRDPQNYLGRRFHERFLRVDVMYWCREDRFFVNEIETYACGKFSGPYNPDIFSLIQSRLVADTKK